MRRFSVRFMSMAWLVAALVSSLSCARAAEQEAFTDPAKAGPDFAVQGEYVGDLNWHGAEHQDRCPSHRPG